MEIIIMDVFNINSIICHLKGNSSVAIEIIREGKIDFGKRLKDRMKK